MKAVHFGAGNIGRGFIGLLLYEAGFQVTFLDVDVERIKALRENRAYSVIYADDAHTVKEVKNVFGINSQASPEESYSALATADVITTAVGPGVLTSLADNLKAMVALRIKNNITKPLLIMACENMIGATESLMDALVSNMDETQREHVEEYVSYANTAVDRIVPDQNHEDMLTVEVEPFSEWVIETEHIRHYFPKIFGAKYVDTLKPYIERKLFTVNTGHAIVAYLGFVRGYNSIVDAMNDASIEFALRSALQETGELLIKKYGFCQKEHQAYIDTTIARFKNPKLSDKVVRVGRSPLRKLGPSDRLVQPAKEYVEAFNETPKALAQAIATVLLFKNESDPESLQLQSIIAAESVEQAVERLTGIARYSILFDKVMQAYECLT